MGRMERLTPNAHRKTEAQSFFNHGNIFSFHLQFPYHYSQNTNTAGTLNSIKNIQYFIVLMITHDLQIHIFGSYMNVMAKFKVPVVFVF